MAMFKNLKAQLKAAQDMAAEVRAAIPQSGDSPMTAGGPPPTEVTIVNPTDQAEVARLWDGGGNARGVLMGSHDDMSAGDRPVRTRVHARVCARLRDGGLGPEKKLTVWVGWKVAALLEPGLEIPIELDRETGEVKSIVAKALTTELSPRFDEAKKIHKSGTFDFDLDGLTQAPAALKEAFEKGSPAPPAGLGADHPLMVPINGVTWEQYIGVRAYAAVHELTTGIDAVAQQHGVEAGAWDEAYSGWTARVTGAPPLAAQFGWDLDRAQKQLRDAT